MNTTFEWSAVSATLPGEAESGDRHLACSLPDGMLFAAVDGLGHGSQAAAASRVAVETLQRHAGEPVATLLARCHDSLRLTRGAAMNLASFNSRHATMFWIGVGNVEGLLLRANPQLPGEKLLCRNGVVGSRLPQLQAAMLPVAHGDVLVFATDGIASDFVQTIRMGEPTQAIAERVLARHNKGTDDALVLVARYKGVQL
jgi:serine/threonine protein phosphatase PrpC